MTPTRPGASSTTVSGPSDSVGSVGPPVTPVPCSGSSAPFVGLLRVTVYGAPPPGTSVLTAVSVCPGRTVAVPCPTGLPCVSWIVQSTPTGSWVGCEPWTWKPTVQLPWSFGPAVRSVIDIRGTASVKLVVSSLIGAPSASTTARLSTSQPRKPLWFSSTELNMYATRTCAEPAAGDRSATHDCQVPLSRAPSSEYA